MTEELKQAAKVALKQLSEARGIIRASSYRHLAKEWDRRATAALSDLRTALAQAQDSQTEGLHMRGLATGILRAAYYDQMGELEDVKHELEQAQGGKAGEAVRWYCLSVDGMATLCSDEDDARQTARDADLSYPRQSPHQAVQLAPVTPPAPGVPEFSRIAKLKLTELQGQGFSVTGYAIQRGTVRGFIDSCGFVGWWRGDPAPGVPEDVVRDAERWRVARDLLAIEDIEHAFSGWVAFGRRTDERESIKADAAIDAVASAMLAASPEKKGVGHG